MNELPSLTGSYVRLEPLQPTHAEAFVQAVAEDPSLYDWSLVPRTHRQFETYIASAIAARDAASAMPFAIVRRADDRVLGSSRFFDLERWNWPPQAPRYSAGLIDGCEIGYTWLSKSGVRTAANTESKLLMLTHAFETWKVLRVCLHTDRRNQRSAAAMERIGAKLEGVLRSHRLAVDAVPRDSLRYSILAEEWPAVKERLVERLSRPVTNP